jgi:outer membrane biosynthesis protein TonB
MLPSSRMVRRLASAILLIVLQPSVTQAQDSDVLSLYIPPLALVSDSITETMPASHRSVSKDADQPVRVLYCPEPRYPRGLGDYGFGGQVDLRFVVDTLGLAELEDLVVSEVSHVGFVDAARRAISKCRYKPASKAGRAVRVLVQQRVVFRIRSSESTRNEAMP